MSIAIAPVDDWQGEGYRRWQRSADLPLLVLSVLLIPVLVIPFADKHLPSGWSDADDAVDYLIWGVFVIDYLARLALARRRLAFVKHNVPDLVLVALPMLRPLRAARLLRVLRLTRVVATLRLLTRHQQRSLHATVVTYVGTVAAGATLLAALVMNEVETDQPGANIHGFGDSVWWALTTVSTVGYGDRYPVTPAGRAIAAVLMVVGVSLFGIITASVATYFVRHVKQEASDTTGEELAARLARVELMLQQLLERQEAQQERVPIS